MKDCCRWYSALRRLKENRRDQLQRLRCDPWKAAFDFMLSQHRDARRTLRKNLPKKPRNGHAIAYSRDPWDGAIRFCRLQHSGIRTRMDWAVHLQSHHCRLRVQKRKPQEPIKIRPTLCPRCTKKREKRLTNPGWIKRCMGQAASDRQAARQVGSWRLKLATLVGCNKHRIKSSRTINQAAAPTTWDEGISRALCRYRARCKWITADPWERWASNLASNNRQRQRRKANAKRKRDQQGAQGTNQVAGA